MINVMDPLIRNQKVMDKFIKCPGMLKESLINGIDKNAYKLENNVYAFSEKDKIVIVKWKDDLTITMSFTTEILLELWKSGKRIKAKRWSGDKAEIGEFGLLSACINFYGIEDYISIESNDEPDLEQFIF